jgi:hypothetical protein
MKITIILCLVACLSFSSCSQPTSTEYSVPVVAPYNFFKIGLSNINGNSGNGVLEFQIVIDLKTNKSGQGGGFMIHRDGATKWVTDANKKFKRFLRGKNYGYEIASERLEKQDSLQLKEFNAWVFFTEMKYLRKWYQDDGITFYYDLRDNTDVEEVLYQHLAGKSEWIELDRHRSHTDEYGSPPKGDTWGSDWREKLLKQYNSPK